MKTIDTYNKLLVDQQSFMGQGIGPLFGCILFLTLDDAQEVETNSIKNINK